jgi:hypothetical protein
MATGSLKAPRPSSVNLTGTASVETDVCSEAKDGDLGFTDWGHMAALHSAGAFRAVYKEEPVLTLAKCCKGLSIIFIYLLGMLEAHTLLSSTLTDGSNAGVLGSPHAQRAFTNISRPTGPSNESLPPAVCRLRNAARLQLGPPYCAAWNLWVGFA